MMMENGLSMEYGDGYMEQEEEWEREGLLDPAWEKQQKKVSALQFYILIPTAPWMWLYISLMSSSSIW